MNQTFEDPVWSQGFTQTPNIIIHDKAISVMARFLYTLILGYCWGDKDRAFPGQDTLAEVMNCSRFTIIRYLVELKEHGLVNWVQRGQGKTNVYTILKLKADVAPMKHQDVSPMQHPIYEEDEEKNTKSIGNRPIIKTPEELANAMGEGSSLHDYLEGKKEIRSRKRYSFNGSGSTKKQQFPPRKVGTHAEHIR